MLHRQGDMFTSDAPALGHGVNTRGSMGAGVAALVRDRYPNTYSTYRLACDSGGLRAGDTLVTSENGKYIFNMATQVNPGPDADLYLVQLAAQDAVDKALALGINRIAIPQIGCGIGGLRWDDVEPILMSAEHNGFQFEVWTL